MPTRGLLFLVLTLPMAGLAATPCTDTAGIATTRSAIEAACPCATIPDARTYRRCARDVIAARVGDGTLASACRRTVRRCVRRSTCGRPDRVSCCRSGGTRCRITTAARCTAIGGCIGVHASCCDACGPSGCNPTTTTTLGPRNCGNYVIDAMEQCDGEPFCENCFAYARVCCQFNSGSTMCSYDMQPPFVCDTGHPSSEQAVYGVFATGTPGACPEGGATDGPCGTPTAFNPTSICCVKQGVCTTEVVSDTAELTFRILNDCIDMVDGQPVPVYVVGTCDGPSGPCVRTH